MDELNWPLMLSAGIVASASPGPATLGIAGTSMRDGRAAGVILAFGIIAGSFIWSVTAAFGVGAILLTHVWILETVRYLGAAYLLYLALSPYVLRLQRPGRHRPSPSPLRAATFSPVSCFI